MTRHRCDDVPGCDGTRLGHDLAVDFPEETKRIDEAFDRLRTPREDRVMGENLQVASAPRRIQRRRTRGWRMPEGAKYVGRPAEHGNPFTIAEYGREGSLAAFQTMIDRTSARRYGWVGGNFRSYPSDDEIRAELAGHDLACWCPLGSPCHADVLLELANR